MAQFQYHYPFLQVNFFKSELGYRGKGKKERAKKEEGKGRQTMGKRKGQKRKGLGLLGLGFKVHTTRPWVMQLSNLIQES